MNLSRLSPNHRRKSDLPRMSNERIDVTELEKRFEDGLNWDDSDTMDLITELKRCYRIIDILQDSEDFDTQVAFHEEGLCKYLKYPCGPCESSEEE